MSQPEVPSIAVLPFANMSADPEQEYFCDGLAEELIDALARLDGLRVVGRTSSFQFKGKGQDLRAIGEQLSARTVLEGSVRKAGNRLRINAQLINTTTATTSGQNGSTGTLDDVFEVQDEIARSVVAQLRVPLLGGARRASCRPPPTTSKHTSCISRGGSWRTGSLCRRSTRRSPISTGAIEHDPGFAAAHAARANAHCWLGFAGARAPHDLYGQARRSAERALELDELLSDAHVAIAAVYFEYEWNWDAADAAFRRALELHPNSAFAHWTYGYYLGNIGRFEESTAHNDQAIDLDPLWVNPHQGKPLSPTSNIRTKRRSPATSEPRARTATLGVAG